MSHDKLIRVFSKHSVADVEPDGEKLIEREFGGEQFDEIRMSKNYQRQYCIVKEARKRLDRLLDPDRDLSHGEQVHQSLEMELALKRKGRKDNAAAVLEALLELLPVVLKPHWPEELQALYDLKHEVLFEWKHYFLSYTNRQAGRTNEEFKDQIESFYAFYPEKEERTKYNWVARMLDRMLRLENISGFFDKDTIRSGDEIEEEIFDYCRKTCAFIQLQERATFAGLADERNWCLEEYRAFKDNPRIQELCKEKVSNRHHFLLTLDRPHKPAEWPVGEEDNYEEWFEHAQRVEFKSIAGKKVTELEQEISEIAGVISKLRDALVDRVLAHP